MRTIIKIALIAPVFLLTPVMASADAAPAIHEQNASTEAPTQVLMAYSRAVSDKDVAAMERNVAAEGADFTVFEGSGANTGWASYRDHHLAPEFANSDLVFHTYAYENIKTVVSGDLAFSTFSIKMVYTYKGEDKSKTGRGTAMLKRFGKTWKIVHLHTS